MDCPQCGARVPAEDAFCGKCGYAMRENPPERLDQSRIRVHEEPAPSRDSHGRLTSQQRIRKHTVLGMPSTELGRPPAGSPPAPTPITATRPSRVSQKTMLGLPRPEALAGPATPASADLEPAATETAGTGGESGEGDQRPSHRPRARVRYDSGDEPVPVVRRRRGALAIAALVAVLSAAWLGYRFFTLHG